MICGKQFQCHILNKYMKADLVRNDKLNLLRLITLGIAACGAVYSLILTIQAGHNNKSVILPILFVIWVLSPFITLIIANISSLRFSVFARRLLYTLMLFITFGSLLGYTRIIAPAGAKPAGVFLIVPLLSWFLMAITYFIVRSKKDK
jgi:hypothetical protein